MRVLSSSFWCWVAGRWCWRNSSIEMHDEDRKTAEGNFSAMNPSTDCFGSAVMSSWEAGGDANLIPHRRNKFINVGGEEMREKVFHGQRRHIRSALTTSRLLSIEHDELSHPIARTILVLIKFSILRRRTLKLNSVEAIAIRRLIHRPSTFCVR